MGVVQGSTLFAGDVSKALIYEISNGLGLVWAKHIRTELNVSGKPRQLTRGEHAGNPMTENVSNPRRPGDFPAGDTITIDGRQLNVVPIMVPDDFTTTDWRDTFPRFQPSGLAIDFKQNPEILKVIFDLILNATQTQINENHSAGDDSLGPTEPLRFYDGYETLIIADADTTQVGTPSVLTSANIVDFIFELRNAIDPRLRSKPNLKFFMSYADFDLADRAFRETQNDVTINTLNGQTSISQSDGSKINFIPIEGLSKNFVFATIADTSNASNLVQGIWMPRDVDTLKLYREVEADQTWNILMRFFCGVNFITGKDIWFLNNI